MEVLPDLAEEQQTIREAVGENFTFLEYHVYLAVLIGLAVFYGLERRAKVSRRRRRSAGAEDSTETGAPQPRWERWRSRMSWIRPSEASSTRSRTRSNPSGPP